MPLAKLGEICVHILLAIIEYGRRLDLVERLADLLLLIPKALRVRSCE